MAGVAYVVGANSFVALDDIDAERNSAVVAGGGLWVGQAGPDPLTAALTDVTLHDNEAFDGGGLFFTGGLVTVERAIVTSNRAGADDQGGGGGIDATGTDLTLRDSTVAGNRAAGSGGGVSVRGSVADIEGRRSLTNTSPVGAGVSIGNFTQTVTVTNSTISGNVGRGFEAFATGTVRLDHVTALGGIVWDDFGGQGVMTSHSSILSGGCIGTGLLSAGFNIVASGACLNAPTTGDQLGVDPQLGPLAANGGSTLTHLPAATSPAIDAADPGACPATDQRGVARPVGPRCDIGAVEVTAAVAAADLTLTLTDSPDPVVAGQPITYTATVTNDGPDAASGVGITIRLPLLTTFLSADPGCSLEGEIVTCTIGDLASGASVTTTVTAAAPDAAGTVDATAEVTSPNDPDPSDNDATASTAVGLPVVSVGDAEVVEGTSATDATHN